MAAIKSRLLLFFFSFSSLLPQPTNFGEGEGGREVYRTGRRREKNNEKLSCVVSSFSVCGFPLIALMFPGRGRRKERGESTLFFLV